MDYYHKKQKALLYYFSGTGNTKIVTEMLKNAFEANHISCDMVSMEEACVPENLKNYDFIGFGYPIYGFAEPEIVVKTMNKLPKVYNKQVFIYKTAGDFIKINHHSSCHMMPILSQKGYQVTYDRIIVMPPNWMVQFNNTASIQLYQVAKVKAKHMVRELMVHKKRVYKISRIIKAVARVTNFFESKMGAKLFGMSLYTTKECTKCGVCARTCPAKNIEPTSYKFGANCIWCMRCVYSCPKGAIKSKGLGFAIIKDGYSVRDFIQGKMIKKDMINHLSKGYMKHYYKYLKDPSI